MTFARQRMERSMAYKLSRTIIRPTMVIKAISICKLIWRIRKNLLSRSGHGNQNLIQR